MRSLCSMRQAILAIASVLSLVLGASASSADENPSSNSANKTFEAQWRAKLCVPANTIAGASTPVQPHIEFSFHGSITETFGPLCYHFAGYNETCLPPQQRWLTPATTIELIAPGQVPVELLQGYILLVRFPWLSEDVYRYPLANTTCLPGRSNNSS